MPRKRWRFQFNIAAIDAVVEDPHHLVRQALAEFNKLAELPGEKRERLVADLVAAVPLARGGVKAGRLDKALAGDGFLDEVGRALERAGLSVTRWSKRYDWGDGPDSDAPESFFFLVARAVAKAFDITLPEDLKLTAERAIKIQRDASEAMKAAQDAELAARARQRLGDLAVRLKAAAPPAAPQPARHHLGIILRKRPLR